MDLTPALLTFCYIKETFDKSGDLMLGLTPLFVPIALTFRGRQFEPAEFVREVQRFYGIRMPEAVAEELAVRLSRSGYLRAQGSDPFIQKLFYKDDYDDVSTSTMPDIREIETQVDALIAHVHREFLRVFPAKSDFPVEQHMLSALANLNFAKELADEEAASGAHKEPVKEGG
jgi:hypothetical protein